MCLDFGILGLHFVNWLWRDVDRVHFFCGFKPFSPQFWVLLGFSSPQCCLIFLTNHMFQLMNGSKHKCLICGIFCWKGRTHLIFPTTKRGVFFSECTTLTVAVFLFLLQNRKFLDAPSNMEIVWQHFSLECRQSTWHFFWMGLWRVRRATMWDLIALSSQAAHVGSLDPQRMGRVCPHAPHAPPMRALGYFRGVLCHDCALPISGFSVPLHLIFFPFRKGFFKICSSWYIRIPLSNFWFLVLSPVFLPLCCVAFMGPAFASDVMISDFLFYWTDSPLFEFLSGCLPFPHWGHHTVVFFFFSLASKNPMILKIFWFFFEHWDTAFFAIKFLLLPSRFGSWSQPFLSFPPFTHLFALASWATEAIAKEGTIKFEKIYDF